MVNFFKKEKKLDNLKDVLKYVKNLEKKVDILSKDLAEMKEKNKLHIQKVGIIRYNPFGRVGGDQSFSIALLDEKNNGFVLTGLFASEGNRVYAKPVKDGLSNYSLSDEEKQAIERAIAYKN